MQYESRRYNTVDSGVAQRTAKHDSARAGIPRHLKVLAVGNSFSQNSMQHLSQIVTDAGAEKVTLGNLYIGGASLETHWNNARNNVPAYCYQKNTQGEWTERDNTPLLYALRDEHWDIITLQQASGFSGIISSFTDEDRLQNVINYVNKHKTNPHARLGWHLTWAYQSNSPHKRFDEYGRDQLTMFYAIIHAVRRLVMTNEAFDFIIPSGTAIQNVRTSYIGDTLTRDGHHLHHNLGCYIAGLAWAHALGWSIDDITWVPDEQDVPKPYLPLIKEAVQAAVSNPFAISISSFYERPRIDVVGKLGS